MNEITLIPGQCLEDIPNTKRVIYPANELSVDRLTRSLLGVVQYKIVRCIDEGSQQMAELVNAYTVLYKAYKENKKPGTDNSETELGV